MENEYALTEAKLIDGNDGLILNDVAVVVKDGKTQNIINEGVTSKTDKDIRQAYVDGQYTMLRLIDACFYVFSDHISYGLLK